MRVYQHAEQGGRCAMNLLSGVKAVTPMPFTKKALIELRTSGNNRCGVSRRISMAQPNLELNEQSPPAEQRGD